MTRRRGGQTPPSTSELAHRSPAGGTLPGLASGNNTVSVAVLGPGLLVYWGMNMHRTLAAAVVLLGLSGMAVGAQRGQGAPQGPPPDGGPPPPGRGRGGPGGGPNGLGGLNTPASNPLTPEKIALGRKLFFDVRLSADRKTSCATCHDPARAFTDGRVVAVGVHNAKGTRNTPSLVNAGNGRLFFWDGRSDSLEGQSLQPMTNPKEMGLSDAEIESRAGLPAADVAA